MTSNKTKSKSITEEALKATWQPKYTIWCMSCNLERNVRGRALKCPNCKSPLHEKRYLF